MVKTGSQIEGDIYDMIKESSLAMSLNGAVFREGYRPKDSRKEDTVVIFTAGEVEEIQWGAVTINIYIPDQDFGDGCMRKDGERCFEVECMTQEWINSLTTDKSCYKFKNKSTVYTVPEEKIHQHIVVAVLRYDYYDGESNDY